MNAIGYNVLTTNSRKEISLNASQLDLDQGIRPEIVIPMDAALELDDTSKAGDEFALGNQVRVTRAPHVGEIGTIESLSNRTIRFPSGIRAVGAEVKVEDGASLTVPLANLEKIV